MSEKNTKRKCERIILVSLAKGWCAPRMNEKEIHIASALNILNWHHRVMRHMMIIFANNFQFDNPNYDHRPCAAEKA